MDAIKEHNERYQMFQDITGEAMRVHRKYGHGLIESAYERNPLTERIEKVRLL